MVGAVVSGAHPLLFRGRHVMVALPGCRAVSLTAYNVGYCGQCRA